MAFIVTPAHLTDTLSAVNTMLASLGEAPVSTLSPPPTSDCQEALERLDEADLNVQSEGWSWNRETALQLSIDEDGHLPLPAMTLRAALSAESVGTFDIVDRGGLIYDRTNHTYVFTAAPKVDLISRLDWDLLPQPARAYILYSATQRFHAGKQGASIVLRVNGDDLARARATLLQYDDEVGQQNSINGNSGVISALYGQGGVRRNRSGA